MPIDASSAEKLYLNKELKADNTVDKVFTPIENYVYLYHTKVFLIIPVYPESLRDSTAISMTPQQALGRSAPIYTYSSSGPRSVEFQFNLHRDMMNQVNYEQSNAEFEDPGDDYVDYFIKAIQSAALPNYNASIKMIDPPMVAVRIGEDFYIKGVVTSGVSVGYNLPILRTGKYAAVSVGFGVSEVDPYDATTVMDVGSYRNNGDIIMNTDLAAIPFSVKNSGGKRNAAVNRQTINS